MNIKDYKNAYDGIHATKDLKLKVLENAEKGLKKKKKNIAVRFILPALGGIAGAAAVFALVIYGTSRLDKLLNGEEISVAATSKPIISESVIIPQRTSVIGEPVSPISDGSDVYEIMPELSLTEIRNLEGYDKVFDDRFTQFDEELINYVGADGFSAWVNKFSSETSACRTFYDQMTHLGYVTYFEISEEDAAALFTTVYSRTFGASFSDELVKAVARRGEKACSELFTTDSVKITDSEGTYTFYTVYDIYGMPTYELARLIDKTGTDAEKIYDALTEFADAIGREDCKAAVKRKILLIRSQLFEKNRPALKSEELSKYYRDEAAAFGLLEINGCIIDNYVSKLVTQKITDERLLTSAFEGANTEPNGRTVPSWNRLLDDRFGITQDELREAVELIDCHYYGQTGEHLYTDREIDIICGKNAGDAFEEAFALPTVLRSNKNPLGALWIDGESFYKKSVSGWLEYRDLPRSYIEALEARLDGTQGVFLKQKAEMYYEIRFITAAYLDGGAMARDEDMLVRPYDGLPEKAGSEIFTAIGKEGTTLTASEIYDMSLTGLAELYVNGEALIGFVRGLSENYELDAACAEYLIKKAYLYTYHTGYVNTCAKDYISAVLSGMECRVMIVDNKYAVARHKDESLNSFVMNELVKWHINAVPQETVNNSNKVYVPDNGETADGSEEGVFRFTACDAHEWGRERGEMTEGYFLDTDVNPILPGAGDRGLFFCAPYGYDKWLDSAHSGIDFAPAEGDVIAALFDGTVKSVDNDGDYLGVRVIITSSDGEYEAVYYHCAKALAEAGQKVTAGESIALVGQTGCSIGPHLHFEINKRYSAEVMTAVDPMPYLVKN